MADVPDIYTDSVRASLNVWGLTLSFGIRSVDPEDLPEGAETMSAPRDTKALVRMGHLHAKVMTMIMRRLLKEYEENAGEDIHIPDEIASPLNLQEEDW